ARRPAAPPPLFPYTPLFRSVNLYPFEQTVAKPGVAIDEAIEQIDIGGPSMVRSAAKNHAFVTLATDPAQYETILQQLQARGRTTDRKSTRLNSSHVKTSYAV